MKVLVAVKRVVDANFRIRLKGDGSGVDLGGAKMAMNPFDEIALEEAIRLKEKGIATEIVAVSVGPAKAEETLRQALAMGADSAILLLHEGRTEPLGIARVLKSLALSESADLVLLGKQAIDDDANQTGQMLAALLGWGQATFASSIEITGSIVRVTREVDSGLQVVELELPAVVTADLRLNTPRYAALPAIMKARNKPIVRIEPATLGVDLTPLLAVIGVQVPPDRPEGTMVASVAELVERLRTEAKVI